MNKKIILGVVLSVLVLIGVFIAKTINKKEQTENSTTEENSIFSDAERITSATNDPIQADAEPSVTDRDEEKTPTSSVERETSAQRSDVASEAADQLQTTVLQVQTKENAENGSGSAITGSEKETADSKNETTGLPSIEPILPEPESDNPVLKIDSVNASAGDDDVVVAVRVEKNLGVLGMSFVLHYDDSAMRLTEAEQGPALSELNFTAPKKLDNGCVFTWFGETLDNAEIRDGVILNLHFSVAESALQKTYSVELVGFDGNCYDRELSEVHFGVENGSVNVK